ncbi:eukaryotic translation initiation factor 4E-binding protein 3 [Physeter macrocephalus]|uniref:Eukaryotic translation initiation factor 4E-binding protein 3 n=1 Tax=Physeter macrocephalus TaxID=9755 RepID=A0A9W2WU31_PHYMC|nr:eukaryotic translation initiation factor 4E-binding protein 3 [Physeter catodon]XP_054942774.1 eukaryotic translation initiation factor 4E-binding protein 3 [Physeter catodon]
MSTSTSCPIPRGRDWLPDCYSTTLGGTLYSTTPGSLRPGQRVRVAGRGRGGTRIIYDRKFLLECKNSPIAQTPPCCLPQIPGVTTPTAPPSRLEERKEQKETEEEIPDDAQFEMDI